MLLMKTFNHALQRMLVRDRGRPLGLKESSMEEKLSVEGRYGEIYRVECAAR